jgi:hypothetical protein
MRGHGDILPERPPPPEVEVVTLMAAVKEYVNNIKEGFQ